MVGQSKRTTHSDVISGLPLRPRLEKMSAFSGGKRATLGSDPPSATGPRFE